MNILVNHTVLDVFGEQHIVAATKQNVSWKELLKLLNKVKKADPMYYVVFVFADNRSVHDNEKLRDMHSITFFYDNPTDKTNDEFSVTYSWDDLSIKKTKLNTKLLREVLKEYTKYDDFLN